jgi:hypothetical protein
MLLALCAGLCACNKAAVEASPPRGALLILVDGLRADRVSLLGHGRPTDAGLLALAERSTLFERAFSPAPWPAAGTASVLTGLDPDRHGLERGGDQVEEGVGTLAEWLAELGFGTAAFAAGAALDEARGTARGFETVRLLNPIAGPPAGAGEVVRAALEWIHLRPAGPFLMHLQLRDVRQPYGPPDRFEQHIPLPRPPDLSDDPMSPEARRFEYERGVRYALDRVGELLEELDRRAMLDPLLVVVAGSCGQELGERGEFGDGHGLSHELLHVPLLVKLPGQREARRVSAPVSLSDLAPTVCDALGVPSMPDLDGRSLVPLARGNSAPGARPVFASVRRPGRCIGEAVIDWPLQLQVLEKAGERRDVALLHDLSTGSSEDLLADRPGDASRLLDLLADHRARARLAGDPPDDPRGQLHPSIIEALQSF